MRRGSLFADDMSKHGIREIIKCVRNSQPTTITSNAFMTHMLISCLNCVNTTPIKTETIDIANVHKAKHVGNHIGINCETD